MDEARDRAAWDHTASLLAMLVNANPFRGKGSPIPPSRFHPYAAAQNAEQAKPVPVPFSTFLKMFVPDAKRPS